MSVYLLFYDTDDGSREEWNTFYTPVEAFPSAEARQLRRDWLSKKYKLLEFYELDLKYETHADIQRPIMNVEEDDEDSDD